MKSITVNVGKNISVDIEYGINSIDQATVITQKDLNVEPFDKMTIKFDDRILFSGIITDVELNQAFGQQCYSYVVTSPLFKLQKSRIPNKYSTFLQIFLEQCCELCDLELDYRFGINPLIPIEQTDYFSMLKKSVIYTKNWNTRFYVDYENGKLVYTATVDGMYPKVVNAINYSFEYNTDVVQTVKW